MFGIPPSPDRGTLHLSQRWSGSGVNRVTSTEQKPDKKRPTKARKRAARAVPKAARFGPESRGPQMVRLGLGRRGGLIGPYSFRPFSEAFSG